jgi:hypothetical protein
MEFYIKITEPEQGLFIVAESKYLKPRIQARQKKLAKSHVNQNELETQIALIEHFKKTYS